MFATRLQFLGAQVLCLLFSTVGPSQGQVSDAPAKGNYKEIPIPDAGAIHGRVSFKGEVPKGELEVFQDKQVCTHDAKSMRPSRRLIVDANGGVAQTVVYLKEINAGKPLSELKPAAILDQRDCRYEPFVQIVPFKESLKVLNSDPLNHNVHGKIEDKTVFNDAMPNTQWPQKDERSKRMTRPGIVSVNCDVHLWMSAYIFVVRHPYYAVTCEDGSFELANVPPGEYEVALWHAGWEATLKRNAQGMPSGYAYSDPIERSAKVKVEPGGKAEVNFTLSE